MKKINLYITEKLHLNKDIEVWGNTTNDIIDTLNLSKYEHKECIKRWVNDNNIEVITIYCDNEENQSKEYNWDNIIFNKKMIMKTEEKLGANDYTITLYTSDNFNIYSYKEHGEVLLIEDYRNVDSLLFLIIGQNISSKK